MSTTLLPLLLGLATGLSLIVAIGAQNAYVLSLGLRADSRTLLPVVLFCVLSDAVLIVAGVVGVGAVIQHAPFAVVVVRVVGSGFLIVYGLFAVRRMLRPRVLEPVGAANDTDATVAGVVAGASQTSAGRSTRVSVLNRVRRGLSSTGAVPTLGTALAAIIPLTWLNPHVYLDTVVFLGSVANEQGSAARWWWTAGAVLGSCIWFFSLGFGARLLRPLFARPGAWRVLDGVIAVVMIGLGIRMAVAF